MARASRARVRCVDHSIESAVVELPAHIERRIDHAHVHRHKLDVTALTVVSNHIAECHRGVEYIVECLVIARARRSAGLPARIQNRHALPDDSRVRHEDLDRRLVVIPRVRDRISLAGYRPLDQLVIAVVILIRVRRAENLRRIDPEGLLSLPLRGRQAGRVGRRWGVSPLCELSPGMNPMIQSFA